MLAAIHLFTLGANALKCRESVKKKLGPGLRRDGRSGGGESP